MLVLMILSAISPGYYNNYYKYTYYNPNLTRFECTITSISHKYLLQIYYSYKNNDYWYRVKKIVTVGWFQSYDI